MPSVLPLRSSSIKRRVLCPGSAKMEFGLPDISTPEAEHGTMLHEVMAGTKDKEGLSHDDLKLVEDATEMRDAVHRQIISTSGKALGESITGLRKEIEVELFLRDDQLNPLISRHADEVLINETKRSALIVDYKFGKIPVDDAPSNLQLRTYAVMLADQEDLDEVWAAIIQPAVSGNENTTIALFDKKALLSWKNRLAELASIVNSEEPPLIASQEACHYCKARGICPAAREQMSRIVTHDKMPLSVESLPELLAKCIIAERVVEKIRSAARELLAGNPEAIPGWRLKPVQRRVIRDPVLAFEKISDVMSSQDFATACSVKIAELERKFVQTMVASGMKPGEAKREFGAKMGDAIDTRTDNWLVPNK